jgi:DNA topoisomerase-1
MAKNLVIVESPAKAKTIEKFLGKDFQVESCFGHIADLPSGELGVDVDGDFEPKYLVSTDKKAVVKKLKSLADKSEVVWLASDEDREGEAIAWHLQQQLELNPEQTKRIVFHEITKKAIIRAIDKPRSINYNMVDAQQARRVLDRIVGYELSPVLWRKIKGGLSAGRVQSVAVRLIVERERDIQNFNTQGSFKVTAEFTNEEGKKFKANLPKQFSSKSEAESFLNTCIGADFKVETLQKKPATKSPSAPFTTSTLQQEASRKLGFPVGKTMMVAQRLYEAGFITYMRTDSVNLSNDAKKNAVDVISSSFGESYSHPRDFKNKSKGAQEAHEAIRPTSLDLQEISGEFDQKRLYQLIWKRTIASQMSDAKLERTVARIGNSGNSELLSARGEMIKFDGFLKVYLEGVDNAEEEQDGMLPKLSEGMPVSLQGMEATERFSQAPYRFTEASLVKKLEELGIGRPSTYAPTISTIQKRTYVQKGTLEGKLRDYDKLTLVSGEVKSETLSERFGSDKGKLTPTDIGMIVNDFLLDNFPNIMDYSFTSQAEEVMDNIAEGNEDWKKVTANFYKTFHESVTTVSEQAERESGERILGEDPKTGKPVLVRLGKFGPIAQIGGRDEEEKQFASLQKDQMLGTITLEEALDLFLLPKKLGEYEGEEVIVSNGRFGPYIRFGKTYVSLPRDENPMDVDSARAIELIQEKQRADAPIAFYEELPVQKGVGRFGPYLKWNSIFINVNKKYDFDNLSNADIEELIEDKKRKEREKIIHNWEEEGVRVEKARWGRSNIIKGKTKIELPKTVDAAALTFDEVLAIIEKNAPKKRKVTRKTTKKKK